MPPAPHSRFAINVPAAIGVAVVFVVAVAAWVAASQLGGDDATGDPTIPPASLVTTPSTVPETSVVAPSTFGPASTVSPTQATTPIPLPTNVVSQGPGNTTTIARPPAVTAAPAATTTTSAPSTGGQSGGAGDLGVSGHEIQQPTCDGAFVTVIASIVGEGDAVKASVAQQLSNHPDASYLRTDQSCSSFRQDVDGEPIYVVYLGPFAQPGDACAARANTNEGAYVKRLTNGGDAGPGCSTD